MTEYSTKTVWRDMDCDNPKVIWRHLNNTVKEISKMKANNNIDSIVSRLVFGAVVYFIWQKRNTRMFKQIKRNEESLVQTIKETVRLRMRSFSVKESKAVREWRRYGM
ncbi:hypothetical protein Tco_0918490 [Tanacetum coccineum]